MNIPIYSKDLIKQLGELIPPKCPSLDTPAKEIYFYTGQYELVRVLIESLEAQENEGDI